MAWQPQKLRTTKKKRPAEFEALTLKNGASRKLMLELEPETSSCILEPGQAVDVRFYGGKLSKNLDIYISDDRITLMEEDFASEIEVVETQGLTLSTEPERRKKLNNKKNS